MKTDIDNSNDFFDLRHQVPRGNINEDCT